VTFVNPNSLMDEGP